MLLFQVIGICQVLITIQHYGDIQHEKKKLPDYRFEHFDFLKMLEIRLATPIQPMMDGGGNLNTY